jgi:tetratricopeptide (TPR) repeat protein
MRRHSLLLLLLLSLPAHAQTSTQSFVIKNGKVAGGAAGGNSGQAGVTLSDEQKLMFEAPAKIMARDYQGAEAIYTRVLAMNGGNTEAYLQRGIVRRELGNKAGMQSDARAAVTLANTQLQRSGRNAHLYYQRAMGLRLLGRFAEAKRDLQTGMSLSGNQNWQTDLKAIELEEKMAASQ